MGYTERQAALWAEALRVIPGVMAAKHRMDVDGAATLIDGYRNSATSLGITDGVAWSVLWSATLQWAMELAKELSSDREIALEQMLQALGHSALESMAAERGVGGY